MTKGRAVVSLAMWGVACAGVAVMARGEDAITSGTPATPDAPANGRKPKTPAPPPTKADAQPN